MHASGPTLAHFLLHGAARELQPDLVEKSTKFVRSGNPDHHRRCVGHAAEPLLALPQRLFSALALSDVLTDAYARAVREMEHNSRTRR